MLHSRTPVRRDISQYFHATFTVAIFLVFPSIALAADPFASGATWFTELLKEVATLMAPIAVITIGFLFWLQQMSMKTALLFLAGCVLIFGASYYSAEIRTAFAG
jgi:type IV secretory pathway VirB2 component (pilin)